MLNYWSNMNTIHTKSVKSTSQPAKQDYGLHAFSSGDMKSPMGKFGETGIPKKSGGFTRSDAWRNVQMERAKKDRKDTFMLIRAKNRHNPTVVSRISLVKRDSKTSFHATGVGTIEGDMSVVKAELKKNGYTHYKSGVVKISL